LPEQNVREILRRRGMTKHTSHTITNAETLIAELECVRLRGYAMDREETMEGLCCVGAPIFDELGRAVAAISISGPAFRFNADKIETLAETLRNVTRELTEAGSQHETVSAVI
jgi:IclR family KDG regulon transcriptional repressor